MRSKAFWYLALPALIGLAMIVVAVLLSSASPGSPVVPGIQAQEIVPACELDINKRQVDIDDVVVRGHPIIEGDDDEDVVAFLIAVTNLGGNEEMGCENVEVADFLGTGLECEDAYVLEDGGLDWQQPNPVCPEEDADAVESSGTAAVDGGVEVVPFFGAGTLTHDDEVELVVIARREFRRDCVVNEACVEEGMSNRPSPDGNGVCDREITCEPRHPRTPTPTVTNTPVPPTSTPIPPTATPTVKPLATLAPPPTGSGSNGGGWSPLALALAATGGVLLLSSGAALAKKRIR